MTSSEIVSLLECLYVLPSLVGLPTFLGYQTPGPWEMDIPHSFNFLFFFTMQRGFWDRSEWALTFLTLIGTRVPFYRERKYFSTPFEELRRTLRIPCLIEQRNQKACSVFAIVLNACRNRKNLFGTNILISSRNRTCYCSGSHESDYSEFIK